MISRQVARAAIRRFNKRATKVRQRDAVKQELHEFRKAVKEALVKGNHNNIVENA